MQSKKRQQKQHARKRAWLRFDFELTDTQYSNLIKFIQSGKAKFVERQSNRVSVFELPVGEKIAIAVYDKERKTIVTLMPPDMFYGDHLL